MSGVNATVTPSVAAPVRRRHGFSAALHAFGGALLGIGVAFGRSAGERADSLCSGLLADGRRRPGS